MPLMNKLYTVEEFEAYIALPENRERRFELIQGEIVEKMPTQKHAALAGFFYGEMYIHLKVHPIGWVLVEARYQMPEDKDHSYIPDVSFVSDRNRVLVERGAAPYMPDLAIEIMSPDDSLRDLRKKARYYLANGSQLVWLVIPQKRLVEVYTPDDDFVLTEGDILTGGDVLPGFTLAVKDIFQV